MIKYLLSILFAYSGFSGISQNITAFTDANNRLYQFDSGEITQVYYQPTKEVHIGNRYLCYVDSKGDVYTLFYGEKMQMAQTYNEIYNTDNLLLVKTASVLRVFDRGVRHVLTSNALSFGIGDSLVLFQDAIGGYLKYYYNDEVHEIGMVVGNYPIRAGEVGANTFVYKDNAGNNMVFWHGAFYDLFSSNQQATYHAGQDVVAFNDPQSMTFAAFDNGYVVDVDPQHALAYKCGNNFIYFKDASEAHKVYREENVMELGFDLQGIDVKDSVIVFKDVGITKIWYENEIYQIYNTKVSDYQVDGGIVAYTNNNGGVSAFVRGKEVDITNTKVESYELHGNTILLRYSRSSYSIWWNGKMYDF